MKMKERKKCKWKIKKNASERAAQIVLQMEKIRTKNQLRSNWKGKNLNQIKRKKIKSEEIFFTKSVVPIEHTDCYHSFT